MRIHTDSLAYADFYRAAEIVQAQTGAPVYFHGAESLPRHGSRSRRQAFDVKLASDGTLTRRRVNYGTAKYADRFDRPYAPTWQQWGWFLAALYAVDPRAIAGPYADAADFHRQTHDEFAANLSHV